MTEQTTTRRITETKWDIHEEIAAWDKNAAMLANRIVVGPNPKRRLSNLRKLLKEGGVVTAMSTGTLWARQLHGWSQHVTPEDFDTKFTS